ncbi:ApeA N-terminal domain 1-containing protein [Vibrio campbellii]|uniref:ApeA N-terminal domain 1-containing protein n=1 Tax=Vibrio campbellii TaxID=680 RepID=UPI003734CC5C
MNQWVNNKCCEIYKVNLTPTSINCRLEVKNLKIVLNETGLVKSIDMELTLDCEKTINVKLDDGRYAILTLERGRYPKLDCANEFDSFISQDIDEVVVHDYVSGGKSTFYLSGRHNSSYDDELFDHVYTGDANRKKITQVSFIMPQLSVYFNHEIKRRFEESGDMLAQTHIESLNAELINSKSIKSVDIFQSKHLKDNDYGDGFVFTSTLDINFTYDAPVSMSEISKLRFKVINLFTWIFGTSSYLTRIDLFDEDSNKGYLYVPTHKAKETEKVSQPYPFMPADQLRASFQAICQSYFVENSFVFDEIWAKTIPLFSIKNVLEYELMLYASILDKYFSYKVDQHELSNVMPQNDYAKLISRLANVAENEPLITDAIDKGSIVNIANEVTLKRLIPNSNATTFNKKAKIYLRYIGKTVSDVFINDKDFYQIKEIRDRAAHGEMEVLHTQQVYLFLNKIKMLTMYLIYRDLGISDHSFLELLCLPFHEIKQGCVQDTFKRDVALGKANIMQVNESTFNFVKKERGILSFVFSREQHTYHVDKKLTLCLKEAFWGGKTTINKYRNLEEFVQSQIPNNKKAAYLSESYIRYGNQTYLMRGIIVIDKLPKLKSFNRARISD